MAREPVASLTELAKSTLGVFRGRDALRAGVTRDQLTRLHRRGVIERVFPDTYRMAVVAESPEQALRAALMWAGGTAAAAGRSAGHVYGLEGVAADRPEIVVPRKHRGRADGVTVRRTADRAALRAREWNGFRVTGVEPTLVALASVLGGEALEVACEDARRRRLTTVPALQAYLADFGRQGRNGVGAMRLLLAQLDPVHAARSTLEVKTRRLLLAHGCTEFVREFPLTWNGRTYRFDFGFERSRTILETNGKRWHDDPADYERDNEKWSVPGRLGYRLVFATWDKVTRRPNELLHELATMLAA